MDTLDQAYEQMQAAGLNANALSRLQTIKASVKPVDQVHSGIKKAATVAMSPEGGNMLLFKPNQSSPRGILDIIEACGELLLARAGEIGHDIWSKHLIFADPAVGLQFQEKLCGGQFSTFQSIVESFSKPTERLVALHFANALLASRMSFGDACAEVKVTEWPQTAGLANGDIPYSLTPLVSAYCDEEIWKLYPKAFAARVTGNLECGHQDVLEKLKLVIDAVSCAGEYST